MSNGTAPPRAIAKRARRAMIGSQRIQRRVRARLRQRLFGFKVQELESEKRQEESDERVSA